MSCFSLQEDTDLCSLHHKQLEESLSVSQDESDFPLNVKHDLIASDTYQMFGASQIPKTEAAKTVISKCLFL